MMPAPVVDVDLSASVQVLTRSRGTHRFVSYAVENVKEETVGTLKVRILRNMWDEDALRMMRPLLCRPVVEHDDRDDVEFLWLCDETFTIEYVQTYAHQHWCDYPDEIHLAFLHEVEVHDLQFYHAHDQWRLIHLITVA